ncbi:hypothetical protein rsdtw13_27560 [Clostridium sp. TW13]|uniref:Uncharacterized protein n=1 Tax=Inconstantimicrobium mannanitabidum TaxID=1604901 RepID=A0ACB5REL7_9CLOT|nr:hypothetical protein rsdtw13_27560 [Clostridium sp. TW13]
MQSVEYGHGATAPEVQLREGYTFAGWDKSFDHITGNVTVKATYTSNHYDVTFQNYDGTQIGTAQSVEYGHGATAPEAPVREGYTFTGWDKSFDHITGNVTVKATYTINHYTVTFQNYDGTQIGTAQSVEYGNEATAPEVPAREGYTFIGWDRVFNNITSNVEVKAMYAVNHSTVTFVDYNGAVIGNPQTIEYGKPAIAPSVPTRKGYTFIGWNKNIDSITGNLTVTAKYEINHYVVIFKDYNGTVLSTQNIEYGKDAVAPNEPTRIGYKFSAWDKKFNNISENIVATAVYVTGITYNIPEKSVDKNTKEVKTALGYFTSGKNTIVVNTKEAHLIIPTNVVSSSDLSGVDYIKVLQKTVDSTSKNELIKKLPSDVKTVGAVLDFRIQLFNYNNALIKDIHKFANNQQVKISIKLNSEDIKNIDTSKLSVYYYDDSIKKWIELGGSFDKNTMEFNYYTSHFTKFAVMQKTKNNAETNKNNESTLPKPASSEKSSSKITDAKTNLPQTGSAVDLIDLLSISGVLVLSGIWLVRRKIK